MALTEDQIRQQINVLATKTSENSEMVYKANATLNKALNPEFFSGNATKIVNAINQLALSNKANEEAIVGMVNKVNDILLDTSNYTNNLIWEEVKELSGKDTIIECINSILKGDNLNNILNISIDDVGKVLVVEQKEDGEITTVAKFLDSVTASADKIEYFNELLPEVNNIKDAIDFLIANPPSNNGGGITNPSGSVDWDNIQNKPNVGNALELDEDSLDLIDENGDVLSSIELVSDDEIDDMLS